jgi:peptidoglycan/LPS O-acetylase OafA/YrhL
MNINKRVFGLDLLRAAAILFVVIDHGNLLLPDLPRKIADLFVFDGVAIFFVLSGYLIGGILLDKLESGFNQHSLLDFWIRRWFRTLPNY